VDGSELVFILMPIVIPLFLAIGIAAPYPNVAVEIPLV